MEKEEMNDVENDSSQDGRDEHKPVHKVHEDENVQPPHQRQQGETLQGEHNHSDDEQVDGEEEDDDDYDEEFEDDYDEEEDEALRRELELEREKLLQELQMFRDSSTEMHMLHQHLKVSYSETEEVDRMTQQPLGGDTVQEEEEEKQEHVQEEQVIVQHHVIEEEIDQVSGRLTDDFVEESPRLSKKLTEDEDLLMKKPQWIETVAKFLFHFVRIVLTVLYFFVLSMINFLFFPAVYVRSSMVNATTGVDIMNKVGFSASSSNKSGSKKNKKTSYSPMQSFFRAEGHIGLLPRPRVILVLLLGALLGYIITMLTEDEFLFGQNYVGNVTEDIGDSMVEEVYPVAISFDHVGCKVPERPKPILFNVTGHIPAGQVTGILGPSGAGKSTFAAMLLGRGDRVCSPPHGSVYLNGERRSLSAILDRVGFVPQHDAMYEDLTVEETLRFSASWRLPWYYTEEAREKLLEETLDLLDLQSIRHERIGGLAKRVISGGERKRVSIGVELITNPSVLIMDEPTSGLDGAAAYKLMKRLRRVADQKGVSVVVVLHVPSARVFNLLDNVVLLQHGQTAYVGPREEIMESMQRMGFETSDIDMPPAEWLLDIVAGCVPYPKDMCPFEHMMEELFGRNNTACNGKETLPMRWRRFVDESDELYELAEPKKPTEQEPKVPWHAKHMEEACANLRPGPKKICAFIHRVRRLIPIAHNHAHSHRGRRIQRYPRVAKPGLVHQATLWTGILTKVTIRRGIMLEILSTSMIGLSCAWVRSYSQMWDARAMAAFFVCVTIQALGIFSAVFEDIADPVKRAAASGMVLGAHHNALVALNVFKGLIIATYFTVIFHITLVLRTGELTLISLKRWIEMIYICAMGFIVSWAVGSLLCVCANHHFQTSCILCIGYLLWAHVFAMYSPNNRQIALDSLVLEKYDVQRPIRLMCSMSPARYFIEAFTLWDSTEADSAPEQVSARNFMLKYFGYKDENLSTCLSTLFAFSLSIVVTRWFYFGAVNSTDFHSLYDTPLFAKFLLKYHVSLSLSLAVLITLHEEKRWIFEAARQRRVYTDYILSVFFRRKNQQEE